MDQAELDRIVGMAENASAQVRDGLLKEQTYKIVLTELLRQRTGYSPAPAVSPNGGQPDAGQTIKSKSGAKGGSPIAKVATWIGVEEDVLSEIFEFGDTAVSVHLPHTVLPRKAADAQRLLAHIKLATDKIGYDADEVSAKDLIAIFDDHGCKDKNLAKNLKASGHIITKGGKGTMKSYKMRYTGMSAAQSEIQNVIGGGA